MKQIRRYEFSEEQNRALKKARCLEWISVGYIISVIYLMYMVMGSSQAMKSAWLEDCLSLIPPLSFLIASHICWRPATKHYPYGFHRVVSVLYLCAAVALLGMGAYLITDAVLKLFEQQHPGIGMKSFFGHDMWLGWWMIIVLLWGTFPPVILGYAKVKYAKSLNDKILITDGRMNKADWMTAVVAITGVLGIGLGWWWADAVAAAFISIDILKDGLAQTRDAVTGLMNRAPTTLDGGYLDLPDRVREYLEKQPDVASASVRMYEHGHLFLGEGFLMTRNNKGMSPEKIGRLTSEVESMDWRLQGFALTLCPAKGNKT